METRDAPQRRASYILAATFLILAAGIISAGYVYYQSYEKRYRAEVEHQLSAIADLKTCEIAQWRRERLGDASIFLGNKVFSALVRKCGDTPQDTDACALLRSWLTCVRDNYQYDRVFLLDARGMEMLSVPPETEAVALRLAQDALDTLRSGRVAFLDFHRDSPDGPIRLAVLAPVYDDRAEGRGIGILVLRIDPARYLYPLINRWPGPSQTAETLIVRRDGDEVVYLNNLRFHNDAALTLRFPLSRAELPSAMAISGLKGIIEGKDYRGVPIIADIGPIPDSPWFLIARMDLAEVYAPLHESLWIIISLVGALLVGAGAVVALIWRQQSVRSYKDRFKAAMVLRETRDYLENLITYANAPIIVWDPQFRITRFNHAFEKLTGRAAPDVLGKSLELLFPPDLVKSSMAHIRTTLSGERWETVEIPILHLDGSVRTVLWNSATIFAPDEKTPVSTIAQGNDITERIQKERELQEKNAELERFAYAISHDLKSPLVTVQTFMGYLEQDLSKPDGERIAQDMLYMRAAAGKMGRLLDELLEMSRIGRVANPPVRVTFRALVEEALAAVAGRLAERGVDARVSDAPVVLFGDRARLSEIWQNLIENAVKFMGDQASPRIEIGAEGHGPDTVFFVRDNGMGIEPRYHARVFTLFEKLDPKIEGTGLGLALVKRIVDMYGGKIWVESEGSGRGASVRFTLSEAMNNSVQDLNERSLS